MLDFHSIEVNQKFLNQIQNKSVKLTAGVYFFIAIYKIKLDWNEIFLKLMIYLWI